MTFNPTCPHTKYTFGVMIKKGFTWDAPFSLAYKEEEEIFHSIPEVLEKYQNVEKYFQRKRHIVMVYVEALVSDNKKLKKSCGWLICEKGVLFDELDCFKIGFNSVTFYADKKNGNEMIYSTNRNIVYGKKPYLSCTDTFAAAVYDLAHYKVFPYHQDYLLYKCEKVEKEEDVNMN